MTILLRMAAAKAINHDIARAAPGGFTIAVLWQLLQWLGRQLRRPRASTRPAR